MSAQEEMIWVLGERGRDGEERTAFRLLRGQPIVLASCGGEVVERRGRRGIRTDRGNRSEGRYRIGQERERRKVCEKLCASGTRTAWRGKCDGRV